MKICKSFILVLYLTLTIIHWKFFDEFLLTNLLKLKLVDWKIIDSKVIGKLRKIYGGKLVTVNRGGFAHGGAKLHSAYTLNIFSRNTANPTNCCEFYIIGYPLKAHNSSLDLQ
jgi:hypothetical protein